MRVWDRASTVVGLLVVVAAYGLAGCHSDRAGSRDSQVATPALDPATLGSVSGVVRLAGKAPAPVRIDTTMDPACAAGGTGEVYSEQYAVREGKLANVYVYVKSGPAIVSGGAFSASHAVVMDQKGCVYRPHVIALQAGDFVEFRNEDATMHNVHTMPTVVGNQPIDISEGPNGGPQTRQFQQPETMIPVRCNNHPWMSAFINISPTPWFAVTGTDGSFTLKGMPAGQYVLGLVQEKLGEQDVTVTVKPQAVTVADATFTIEPGV
jgi:plastocyanin